MGMDSDYAAGLKDHELRQAIIDHAASIANNDGRLTSHSSADLDFALDLFDACLAEYAKRARWTIPIPEVENQLVSMMLTIAEIEDGEHATSGRDFGRGMAHAAKLMREAVLPS